MDFQDMVLTTVLYIVVFISAAAYVASRSTALATVSGNQKELHSLPQYYGFNGLLLSLLPALILLMIWTFVQSLAVEATISGMLPDDMVSEQANLNLLMSEVERLSDGLKVVISSGISDRGTILDPNTSVDAVQEALLQANVFLSGDINQEIMKAAQRRFVMETDGSMYRNWLVILTSMIGFAIAFRQSGSDFRARNQVERIVLLLLASAATIAIVASIGIVLSMVFEAVRFFDMHPWTDFFFGLVWAPSFRFQSELAILPLLWGTLYISFVALLVSVPIGLFAAIYLSEYASKSVRSTAKPLLEILAGIPTIVYGLFALTTFGPFLRMFFGDGGFLGVEWMSDSRSVVTAGVVMGMMLIPFVSSLSDDIINAVPQAMRDGSYGLGATQSETVRNVIIPAALPGIIGAILLAASRAIGETMIVVMGAGAVAKFAGNPLEALTTITTRIVSQLTGDLEFDSPETLVAFALGLSLFTLTLCLNVLALYIVRKYREQYE